MVSPPQPSRGQPNPSCLRTKSCGLMEMTLPTKDGSHRRPQHGPNSARRVWESLGRAEPTAEGLETPGTQGHSRPGRGAGSLGILLVHSLEQACLSHISTLILVHIQHPHVKLAEIFGSLWLSSAPPFRPKPKDIRRPAFPLALRWTAGGGLHSGFTGRLLGRPHVSTALCVTHARFLPPSRMMKS